MILGVVGSRTLRASPEVKNIIEDFLDTYGNIDIIVSGGAHGVDSMAELVARQRHIRMEVFHADWDTQGKGAGFVRNGKIAARVDHLLAIMAPGGTSGTKDTITKAMSLGKPVTIYKIG